MQILTTSINIYIQDATSLTGKKCSTSTCDLKTEILENKNLKNLLSLSNLLRVKDK
jgi:hypothetical protein